MVGGSKRAVKVIQDDKVTEPGGRPELCGMLSIFPGMLVLAASGPSRAYAQQDATGP